MVATAACGLLQASMLLVRHVRCAGCVVVVARLLTPLKWGLACAVTAVGTAAAKEAAWKRFMDKDSVRRSLCSPPTRNPAQEQSLNS